MAASQAQENLIDLNAAKPIGASLINVVKWKKHSTVLSTHLDNFFASQKFTDCTFSCEGKTIGAHRIIVAGISNIFARLFDLQNEKHPIIHLFDISFQDLRAILQFAYTGECVAVPGQLDQLLTAAKKMDIKGLNTHLRSDAIVLLDATPLIIQEQHKLKESEKTGTSEVVDENQLINSAHRARRYVKARNNELATIEDQLNDVKTTGRANYTPILAPPIPIYNIVRQKKRVEFCEAKICRTPKFDGPAPYDVVPVSPEARRKRRYKKTSNVCDDRPVDFVADFAESPMECQTIADVESSGSSPNTGLGKNNLVTTGNDVVSEEYTELLSQKSDASALKIFDKAAQRKRRQA